MQKDPIREGFVSSLWKKLESLLRQWLLEDIGRGDVTTQGLFLCDLQGQAEWIIKEDGIVAGLTNDSPQALAFWCKKSSDFCFRSTTITLDLGNSKASGKLKCPLPPPKSTMTELASLLGIMAKMHLKRDLT